MNDGDDSAIATQSHSPRLIVEMLQRQVDNLDEWCIEWKIAIKAEKTWYC